MMTTKNRLQTKRKLEKIIQNLLDTKETRPLQTWEQDYLTEAKSWVSEFCPPKSQVNSRFEWRRIQFITREFLDKIPSCSNDSKWEMINLSHDIINHVVRRELPGYERVIL